MPYYLTHFHSIRPRYEHSQEALLDWIAKAHAIAGQAQGTSYSELKERFAKLQVAVERRGSQIADLSGENWEEKEIYPMTTHPTGKGFTQRSQCFEREVLGIFKQFYSEQTPLPDHIIHVTCTGYVAPSPAQQLVSLKKGGDKTTVTHAYHMGCYAAFPAIRIGMGFVSLPLSEPCQVDIVHTEMCSLHMQPLRHSTEQLIVQSLFADGFMKYRLSIQAEGPALQIIGLKEETIPETAHCMTWRCEDHGLGMTLSKDIPIRIGQALKEFLKRICVSNQLDFEAIKQQAIFAIHPGGPKILKQIEEILELHTQQLRHSQEVLRLYGNMSSATLPHIWEQILADVTIPEDTFVISLAFGPGLSISGGIFQKRL